MLYKIADVLTSVPAAGGMDSRCRAYAVPGSEAEAQIVIDEARYRYDRWPRMSADLAAYMESGFQFYMQLLDYGGLMLHASATVIDGAAYLFAGQCGIGKSTHAALLMRLFPGALLINDDKPALRCIDSTWMAYGTPWAGKHGININAGYPLRGITLLTPVQNGENRIRPADPLDAVSGLIVCSVGRSTHRSIAKLSALLDRLLRDVPVFALDSRGDEAAARMAYEAMKTR